MGRPNTLWGSGCNANWVFYFCTKLFAFLNCFGLVVTSHLFDGLVENPGKGVNFYGKVQNMPFPRGLSFGNADDLLQQRCSMMSDDSSCKGKSFNQLPGITCEIQDPVSCNYSYPYRMFDATCNNPHISRLGMTHQCNFRFTPAYYEGYDGFRQSVKGGPLPEPRDISLQIMENHHKPTVKVSFQFATFAEFVATDIILSAQPPMDCCAKENMDNPECKPISLRPNDPFFSQFNKTCINFQRTYQCNCKTKHRAQQNAVTSPLDLSQLYGVNEEKAMGVRALDGAGKLKSRDTGVGSLLPFGNDQNDGFCPKGQEPICFVGADPRVNHHAIVTSLLTIFMREHNRIATILQEMNPHWGEEQLFQEARKIVIGEFQSIVFKDFMPILLGTRLVEEFDLTVPSGRNGMLYNSSVLLGMWNEFAIASYRLHSMVAMDIGSLHLRFKDIYSNPSLLHQGHLSRIIKGSHQVPAEQFDRYMIDDLTNYLYEFPGMSYGKDLASIHIQRGRDHGLSPYVEIVKFCSDGTVLISSFDDLHKLGLMSDTNAKLLQHVYKSVEDVDMWVGMQLEYHMPGAITGPSSACINAKQFYFTQKGDRFYFDIVGPDASFTADQRNALKQTSYTRILCDNTDMTNITENTFYLRSEENLEVSCDEIPKLDLTLWKDNENSA